MKKGPLPKYPTNKYLIHYDFEDMQFCLFDKDGEFVSSHKDSGRELGRDAWDLGADEVVYDYNLNLDEHVPLIPRHGLFKK